MRKRQPEITRQKIVQAGLELFSQSDFNVVTMRDIAKRAGTGLATIYKHFKGKEELLFSILLSKSPFSDETIQLIHGMESTKEKLNSTIWAILHFYDQDEQLTNIYYNKIPFDFLIRTQSVAAKDTISLIKSILKEGKEISIRLNPKTIQQYLGVPRYRRGQLEEEDRIGLGTGLAWTEVGGELLQTEVTVMPGKGKLIITGKLGDVMQESAQAAMSYVRSRAALLGIDPNFHETKDVHIHVPEGATPKDGPSAGITMATALVSALAGVPVRRDVAMTGEITLRGRILPIGGLKEKVIAAHRGKVSTIIIPEENEKDMKDIPKAITRSLTFHTVCHMDEVLRLALKVEDPDEFFKKAPLEDTCELDDEIKPPPAADAEESPVH